MITIKHCLLSAALGVIAFSVANAQQSQETIQELSKKATKGYIYGIKKNDNGDLNVTYKIAGDNKSDIFFENYAFDNHIKFLNSSDANVPKEDKADRTKTLIYATVGGCTSFSILSMKLKLHKRVLQQSWNHDMQKYTTTKVVTDEEVKAKNDNGKAYKGIASYDGSGVDDQNFIIAANDNQAKKEANPYYILLISPGLDITERTVDISGKQSMVYCDQLSNDDVIMVFAPKKGEADPSAYTYLRYSIKGELLSKVPFKSPSNNMLIINMQEQNGAVYFCATSTKSKDAFSEVFEDYASISNPCFTGAQNDQDLKWESKSNEKMENFHLLKFKGDQMIFASTVPISEFKSKFKASGKGGSVYKGTKFGVNRFFITADEEFLVAGQLTSHAMLKGGYGALGNTPTGSYMKTYLDIVCIYFDKNGGLKAQYSVERLNDDKKSEIFDVGQNFYLGPDKKTLYWEMLEVKGQQGYAGFMDAMNGRLTFYPRYFPRIAKIDLSNGNVSDFKLLGNQKFFLSKYFTGLFDEKENSLTYVGYDEGFKKLWVGKYTF
jgi:hypothetical protein